MHFPGIDIDTPSYQKEIMSAKNIYYLLSLPSSTTFLYT